MTNQDGLVDGLGGTADVLPVGQALGGRMQPGGVIQGKHLRPLLWNLLDEVRFQPGLILSTVLNGGVDARPLAAKDRREAQFRKGTNGGARQQRVHQFKLRVLGQRETVVVNGLTKLD
jgi:hypothetical protein